MRSGRHIAQFFVTVGGVRGAVVGEFIDPISSAGSMGLFGSLIGAAALGVYALWQDDTQNDDDDSNPGGGLMQPVA
jgi:hypothetical protein